MLSPLQLAATALLVLLGAGLSLWMQIGVARPLLVAAARTVVQLLLVGLVLQRLFATGHPALTLLVMVAMLAAATYETFSRQERRFAGATALALAGLPVAMASIAVTGVALATLQPPQLLEPRVAIPLFGIVLGNAMSSASIALNTFTTALVRDRAAVEAQLALGANRFEALRTIRRSAARSGMIPIVNQMAAAGVITLPGMMTGQILAGMAPVEAAKYQVFVLFLLAGAAALVVAAMTYAAAWRATDARHGRAPPAAAGSLAGPLSAGLCWRSPPACDREAPGPPRTARGASRRRTAGRRACRRTVGWRATGAEGERQRTPASPPAFSSLLETTDTTPPAPGADCAA